MVERFVILLVVVAVAGLAYGLWRLWQQRRLALLAARDFPPELLGLTDRERANVLYFTTESCVQCRLQQAPILSQLSAQADVAIHKLDAIEREELARFYGIMTVPTTIVLDRRLRPVAVNHGLVPLPRLQAQLSSVMQGS